LYRHIISCFNNLFGRNAHVKKIKLYLIILIKKIEMLEKLYSQKSEFGIIRG